MGAQGHWYNPAAPPKIVVVTTSHSELTFRNILAHVILKLKMLYSELGSVPYIGSVWLLPPPAITELRSRGKWSHRLKPGMNRYAAIPPCFKDCLQWFYFMPVPPFESRPQNLSVYLMPISQAQWTVGRTRASAVEPSSAELFLCYFYSGIKLHTPPVLRVPFAEMKL